MIPWNRDVISWNHDVILWNHVVILVFEARFLRFFAPLVIIFCLARYFHREALGRAGGITLKMLK